MSAPEELIAGIRAQDRRALARAITLAESTRPDHRADAEAVLEALLGDTGRSVRVGISGAPGVGKSTFIERFGLHVADHGPPGGGAGRRPVVGSHRRLHPGRQDPHDRAVAPPRRVHPPVARRHAAGRGGPAHPRGHAAVRGRRLRRGDGGDHRRGPVRGGGGRHGRPVLPPGGPRRRRRAAGGQAGDHGAGRPGGGQQGRRRPGRGRRAGPERLRQRPAPGAAPLAGVDPRGAGLLVDRGHRRGRGVGPDRAVPPGGERRRRAGRGPRRPGGGLDVVRGARHPGRPAAPAGPGGRGGRTPRGRRGRRRASAPRPRPAACWSCSPARDRGACDRHLDRTRSGPDLARRLGASVAFVALGTAIALLRQPGFHSWNTIWAEDGARLRQRRAPPARPDHPDQALRRLRPAGPPPAGPARPAPARRLVRPLVRGDRARWSPRCWA